MRFSGKGLMAGVASVLSLLAASNAEASSHREAPAISRDPSVDNTDTYAWRCGDALCIAANYDGLQLPEGGPNYSTFSTAALYQMHITHNDASGNPDLKDFITISVDFRAMPSHFGYKQNYTTGGAAGDKRDPVTDPVGAQSGKEFFAQLGGAYDLLATVSWSKNGGPSTKLFDSVPVAPPNIGQRTSTFVYGNPNYAAFAQTFVKQSNGFKFFAGQRDDAFYVNLAQTFDLASMFGLNKLGDQPFRSRTYDLNPADQGQFAGAMDKTKVPDAVAGTNVNSIVLAIPLSKITDDAKVPAAGTAPSNKTLFGVWASASRPAATKIVSYVDNNGRKRTESQLAPLADDGGSFEYAASWAQVSRLGFPLVNEAVIGIQDKDRYNRSFPKDDVANFGSYFLNPVIVRDAEAVGAYAQLGATVTDAVRFNRTDILDVINLKNIPSTGSHNVQIAAGRTGDVLRVDVAVPESSFPNGRPLSGAAVASGKEEDITDIILTAVLAPSAVASLNDPNCDPSKKSCAIDVCNSTPAKKCALGDYVDGPGDGRKLLPIFPYLATPFAGDSEGKGKPAAL